MRVATFTVLPRFTRPDVGTTSPETSPSSVDLPAPLTPRMPVRSPGAMRHSTSCSTSVSPYETDASSRSTTSLPSRETARDCSATLSRISGTSAMSAFAASMRNFGFDVRAGGPRRSHASSLRARFCRRASMTRRLPVALDPLQDVRGVAAVEGLDHPVVHLPRLGADLVEEPPVVRHDEQGAGRGRPAALQVLGEPCDRLDVEVVRRLVEEQHVVVARQQGRERDASALAAREAADPRVPRDVGEQTADDIARARIPRPLVLGASADDHVAHRAVVIERVRLVEDADAHAAAERHASGIGCEAAREHREQARLAVAVAPDDPDAVALVDAERDAVEDDLRRVLQVQGLGPEKMCHVPSRLGE